MYPRLKILISALSVLIPLSGIATPPAFGDRFKHESSPSTVTVSSTSQPVFTTTAGTASCKKSGGNGTVSSPETSEVSIAPSFSECTFLGFPATFHTNECIFTFKITGFFSTTGTVDIQCPPNKELTITAVAAGTTKCTLHIPPQGNLSSVYYSNLGTGATREVQNELVLSGLRYSHTEGSGLGKCTSGTATTGSLSWVLISTAENPISSAHIGFWVS
jgi:hypothetical protein